MNQTGSLKLVRIFDVPSQPAFVTSVGSFQDAEVKSFGANFESMFVGLEVGSVETTSLTVHRVTGDGLLDKKVRDILGGKAELGISRFLAFLVEYRKSSEWFLCYLEGRDGNLWPVNARWYADNDGWFVRYVSDTNPSWLKGVHVISQS